MVPAWSPRARGANWHLQTGNLQTGTCNVRNSMQFCAVLWSSMELYESRNSRNMKPLRAP